MPKEKIKKQKKLGMRTDQKSILYPFGDTVVNRCSYCEKKKVIMKAKHKCLFCYVKSNEDVYNCKHLSKPLLEEYECRNFDLPVDFSDCEYPENCIDATEETSDFYEEISSEYYDNVGGSGEVLKIKKFVIDLLNEKVTIDKVLECYENFDWLIDWGNKFRKGRLLRSCNECCEAYNRYKISL